MIYYIYKIHFLCGFPTGRYYIGKRKYRGKDLSKDSYAGSGAFCDEYYKAYGKREGVTYVKEIIEINPTLKINDTRETELIGTLYKDDPLCMNRTAGGLGGGEYYAREVHQYSVNGDYITKYNSLSNAAEIIGVSTSTIQIACKRRNKVVANCLWRYSGDFVKDNDLDNLDFSYTPVDQYDYDGKFIASFDTIKNAAINLKGKCWKTISSSIAESINCPEKRPSAGGFVWKNRGETPRPEDFEGLKSKEQLIISQYDLEGNLINTYFSFAEAAKAVNGKWQSIQRVCDGKRKTAYGYKWSRNISSSDYAGYSKKQKQQFYESKRAKKVEQYDLTGKLLRTFNSIGEACSVLGLKGIENIRGCCVKKYITSKGFIWRYVDDPDKQLSETILKVNRGR